MIESDLKRSIKKLIDGIEDENLLHQIKTLLASDKNKTTLATKLSARAILAEKDIALNNLVSEEEVLYKTDQSLKE